MSMVRCSECDRVCDSDDDPEGFLATWATIFNTEARREYVFVCERCRDDMSESEVAKRQPQ